ncbi:MAG: MarR family transcriptional regulator [Desulfocapsaceae bacterium]|nr:MarR family transcriptional regulator [Desulfocapsaceae bacterium]
MGNLLLEKDKRSAAEGGGEVLLGPGIIPQVPKNSYELRILQSIRRIIRAIEIHSHKLVQGYEITGPQLACLLALAKGGPLTITQLAGRLYLSPSTIVGIVDRLADKGLAVRQRGSKDRRQVQVCVTEGGETLLASAPSPLQETLGESLKNLPELEQVSITLAFEKVVDMMEARKIEASPVLEVGPISPQTGSGTTAAEAF